MLSPGARQAPHDAGRNPPTAPLTQAKSSSSASFLGRLLPGSLFLRHQESRERARILVIDVLVRLNIARPQRLRIFQVMENPGWAQFRPNLRERRAHVTFIALRIDNVAGLAGIF